MLLNHIRTTNADPVVIAYVTRQIHETKRRLGRVAHAQVHVHASATLRRRRSSLRLLGVSGTASNEETGQKTVDFEVDLVVPLTDGVCRLSMLETGRSRAPGRVDRRTLLALHQRDSIFLEEMIGVPLSPLTSADPGLQLISGPWNSETTIKTPPQSTNLIEISASFKLC